MGAFAVKVRTLSRASSQPQGLVLNTHFVCAAVPVGARLAREEARSGTKHLEHLEHLNPAETSPWPAAQFAPESNPPCA